MPIITRARELNKRRSRKRKLRLLRTRFAVARTEEEKAHILGKVRNIAAWLSEEQFLAPLNK